MVDFILNTSLAVCSSLINISIMFVFKAPKIDILFSNPEAAQVTFFAFCKSSGMIPIVLS